MSESTNGGDKMTYIQRLLFTGSADIKTLSLHKGQKVTFSGNSSGALRVALSEPDLADLRDYFVIVDDSTGSGAAPYFSFIADDDMLLYMRPDADTAFQMHIWVSDGKGGSYHA